MAGKNKNKQRKSSEGRIAAQNRRARHDYLIEQTFETGIVLVGTEIKSLRQGLASINESYATEKGGELFLVNSHIPEYQSGRHFGHEPRRPRKLLLHRREIAKLIGAIKREGMTLVPLSIYFNQRGLAKVTLALARGKHKADKRAADKEREWKKQKSQLIRARI
jgi:SsrA-binding protein